MHTVRNRTGKTNLLERLSPRHLRLLIHIGRLADEWGVSVYLVGGFVRDLLLKRKNWDLDLTVERNGIAFAREVADRFDAGLVLFERFATARLVLSDGLKLDFATTRRESYAEPAALPDVATATLQEDLYRRDFTINAMAIQLNAAQFGQLHDPYEGRCDLRAKTVRVLHERSFIDDPTRVFRAIRFAERFGFHLEANSARLLKEAAARDLIAQLSGPRLRNEILLLFSEAHPERPLAVMQRLNLLRFLHPDLRYAGATKQMVHAIPKSLDWWMSRCRKHSVDRRILYLMALLAGAEPAVIETVIARLTLSSEQAGTVRAGGKKLDAVARTLSGPKPLKRSEIYRLLHELPNEALLLCLARMAERGNRLTRTRRRVAEYLTKLCRVKPLLRGDDLLRMGVEPGPEVGQLLARLHDAKLDGLLEGKAAERAFVRARIVDTG